MKRVWLHFPAASLAAALLTLGAMPQQTSRALFDRRILPLLKADKPSSCSECHLSGVDLKDYIRPTEQATFAALVAGKLVDTKSPQKSHLLDLIRKATPRTPLLTAKARDAEYSAFSDWIAAAVRNPALKPEPGTREAGPKTAPALVRHARLDRVVASFERNIWSQQGRCMGCHTEGRAEAKENARKFGERVQWMASDGAAETMRRVIAQGLIDLKKPDQSLLLLKPLNKVAHGGGVKFLMGDAGYKQFRAWIEDYSACVQGSYRSASALPQAPSERLIYTDSIFSPEQTPTEWGDKLLRVDLHAWNPARNEWNPVSIATGDREVSAQARTTNIWLWKIERNAAAKPDMRIPEGRYLLKYYCDTKDELNLDFRTPTDSAGFYQGSQEIRSAWPTGFGARTSVRVSTK